MEFADYPLEAPFDSRNALYIKRRIKRAKQSSIVMCLIGRSAYRSEWLKQELQTGHDLDKCLIGVNLRSDYSATAPRPLVAHSAQAVGWNIRDIVDAIGRCQFLDEGVFQGFVTARCGGQLRRYEGKYASCKRNHDALQATTVISSILTPIFILALAPDWKLLAVATLTVSVSTGMMAAFQIREKWINYRMTAESMRREYSFYKTCSGPYSQTGDPRRAFRVVASQRNQSVACRPQRNNTNLPRPRAMCAKMQRYVKKPIPIKARRITQATKIETLEGVAYGNKGDYLVIGVRGERYIVRGDIFEETYEPVPDK